uniref:NADH dehydrogenase [ubiquinone] 1 alpha subcomplex subunit 3 n=1 Tax=Sciurus vulgaris TaxID=55149 RepID=A0A8D2CJN2_SCIVU
MAAKLAAFLKNRPLAWPTLTSQPSTPPAVILPPLSPYTKYAIMINKATPYNCPGWDGWGKGKNNRMNQTTLPYVNL